MQPLMRAPRSAAELAKLVVVSPHLDDAVFSVGELISGYEGAVIVTCLAGLPPQEASTQYDRDSGFLSSRHLMEARRTENEAACRVLGCEHRELDFLDGQYGDTSVRSLVRALDGLLDSWREHEQLIVLGPLGVKHPDHVLVAKACAKLKTDLLERWVYEELPYRVLWPVETSEVIREQFPPDQRPGFLGDGKAYLKAAAVQCYESQAWSTDMRVMTAPERYWQVIPPDDEEGEPEP